MAFSPFHFVLVCQLLLSLPSFGTLAHLVYESKSIAVPLNRVNPDSPPVTFNLNYKRCSTFVTATDSPVLVGVCGQYELDRCWKNMRILEELAPRLNADILYVEHRFYGKSLPEKAFENFDVLQNLRIEEVMDDIREVVKSEHGAEALQRAILVGEDYGGALALWMGMQKDESKAKPFFVWAASPTPLALSPDAPFSNKFDEQLKQLLTSEFGCSWADVDKVFEWMDKTAADDQKGVKAVRDALHYEVADIDIAKIKANVFEWLRQFASWKVRPSYDEATKKFVWPLEEFCSNLKAKNNDEEKAKFYGDFVLKMAGTSATLLDYEVFLYGEKYEHRAKDFQRCTELVTGNCAAEKTKENCQEEMKTNCKDELLRMYAYDPETMFLPNHIAQTFGFDFSKLQNVLVTGEQFDQFGITAISDLASDPKRHVYSFPSIGLSMRGEEVSTPSSCDPLAMREARTQIADILVCLVGPENCVEHPEWPIVLKEETRQEDAKKHQAQCQTRHWQYPWAEYGKEQLTTSTTTTTATSTTTAAPTTTESVENGASHGKTAAAAGLALLMLLATTMGLTL